MAVLIDPPAWPAHGRLWSHLVSDVSYDELHRFAGAAGVPRRAFEGDHYDVPQERYDQLVAAGARPVPSRDLLRALQRSGLRVPKRKGELVLRSWPDGSWLRDAGPHQVDLIRSALGPPSDSTIGTRLLAVRGGRLALVDGDLPALDGDLASSSDPSAVGTSLAYLRARFDGPRVSDRYPWPRCHLGLRSLPDESDGAIEAITTGPVQWVDWAQARRGPMPVYWWPLLQRQLGVP
ncbi:DUF4031 domain-containing protein [Angustibacter sp. McL0619]|uniref:DUF4031 domain-containing protein n=1 Tax=Angustibacter sp. McL0619 TaxID=3415676 RepID=UPI003CF12FDB